MWSREWHRVRDGNLVHMSRVGHVYSNSVGYEAKHVCDALSRRSRNVCLNAERSTSSMFDRWEWSIIIAYYLSLSEQRSRIERVVSRDLESKEWNGWREPNLVQQQKARSQRATDCKQNQGLGDRSNLSNGMPD